VETTQMKLFVLRLKQIRFFPNPNKPTTNTFRFENVAANGRDNRFIFYRNFICTLSSDKCAAKLNIVGYDNGKQFKA
jgi:hypothetical protein